MMKRYPAIKSISKMRWCRKRSRKLRNGVPAAHNSHTRRTVVTKAPEASSPLTSPLFVQSRRLPWSSPAYSRPNPRPSVSHAWPVEMLKHLSLDVFARYSVPHACEHHWQHSTILPVDPSPRQIVRVPTFQRRRHVLREL